MRPRARGWARAAESTRWARAAESTRWREQLRARDGREQLRARDGRERLRARDGREQLRARGWARAAESTRWARAAFQRLLPFAFQEHSMEAWGGVKGSLRRAKTARPGHRPNLPPNPTEKKAKGRSSEPEDRGSCQPGAGFTCPHPNLETMTPNGRSPALWINLQFSHPDSSIEEISHSTAG
jgi:hypothetical protein